MLDNKVFQSQRDRSRIDVNDPVDVEYVHYQFPWLSHGQIKEVIREHGPDRETVLTVLQRTSSKENA
jgi:hypothetical protein